MTTTVDDIKKSNPEVTFNTNDIVLITIEVIQSTNEGEKFAVLCKDADKNNVQGFSQFVPHPEDEDSDQIYGEFCNKIADLLPLLKPNGNWTDLRYEKGWIEIIRFDSGNLANFIAIYESVPNPSASIWEIPYTIIWNTNDAGWEIAELIANIV